MQGIYCCFKVDKRLHETAACMHVDGISYIPMENHNVMIDISCIFKYKGFTTLGNFAYFKIKEIVKVNATKPRRSFSAIYYCRSAYKFTVLTKRTATVE